MRPRLDIMTRDDRGAEVPLWRLPRQVRGAESEVPEHLRARLGSALAFEIRGLTVRIAGVIVLMMLLLIALTTAWRVVPTSAFMPIQLGATFGMMAWMQRAARKKSAATTRATLLAECHCASCGYDLMDIPADAGDGCTVCPECRAAWRLTPERSLRRSPAAGLTRGALQTDIGEPGVPEVRPGQEPPSIRQSFRWFLGIQKMHRWRGFVAGADDREAVVELASPRVRIRPAREWASVPPEVQARVRSRLRRLGLGVRIAAGLVLLPFFLAFAGMQVWIMLRAPVRPAITLFPLLMQALIAVMLVRFVMLPHVKRPRQIVEIFLEEGLCPSCATDLRGLGGEPEADGCTVCPTCHAAWRLPAHGEERVTAPTLPTSGQPPHHPQPH